MPGPPPLPEDARDAGHLNVLSILHYVWVGLGGVGLLFLVGHYMMMKSMTGFMSASLERANEEIEKERLANDPEAPATEIPEGFFDFAFEAMMMFYVLIGLLVFIAMVMNFLVARAISKRQWRVFIIVVSALNCLSFPLGTALGVFTLVVMCRPSVAHSFSRAAP